VKKAIIVTGPEGCGNRLIAAAFQAAGCYGEGSTDAKYNTELPTDESPVVLIRSFPHGNEWPDLVDIHTRLTEREYSVTYVIPTRDFSCYAASWVKDRPEESDRWQEVYQRAYIDIMAAMNATKAPFILAQYEAIMMRQSAYLSRLVTQCGLPHNFFTLTVDGTERNINDANAKYYN